MLVGPKYFPNFIRETISDILDGTEGAVKTEFLTLLPIKFIGDVTVLVMSSAILWQTSKKNLLKSLAITVGSGITLPAESLRLLITFV